MSIGRVFLVLRWILKGRLFRIVFGVLRIFRGVVGVKVIFLIFRGLTGLVMVVVCVPKAIPHLFMLLMVQKHTANVLFKAYLYKNVH